MGAALQTEVVVVGSGFAGSIMAMILRRQGREVALLERGRHPRFAIGESSTPLANLLLEELAERHGLDGVRDFCKWGAWRRAHPGVGCGLKRGFTFFHHEAGRRFVRREDRRGELLVGASPNEEIADTHWYRPEFDQWFCREAARLGAKYFDQCQVDRVARREGAGWLLECRRMEARFEIEADFIIDASGGAGCLRRLLPIPEIPLPHMPPTQAVYAHFEGVARFEPDDAKGPYPPDDAAVHHLFEGGWIWVLRFANGITSAGAVCQKPLAEELGLLEGAAGWERLLARFPAVRDQFAQARAATLFCTQPQVSFRLGRAAGPGWALLPSAFGFLDPLLSTGFPLALLGVGRLAELFQARLGRDAMEAGLEDYARGVERDFLAAEEIVSGLHALLGDFESFAPLSLLYFAAASYSETMRRLALGARAPGFMLSGDARFSAGTREICAMARGLPPGRGKPELLRADVMELIGPIDLAGLGDGSRRGWHPALTEDLFAACPKLGIRREEMAAMLARCGLVM